MIQYLFFFLWADKEPWPLSSLEDVSLESLELELDVEQEDESDATPVEQVGSTWSAISAKEGSFSCKKIIHFLFCFVFWTDYVSID